MFFKKTCKLRKSNSNHGAHQIKFRYNIKLLNIFKILNL